MKRRSLVAGAGALALAHPLAAIAQQGWPNKPVTLIVPFPPGGGTDAFARPLAAQFAKQLGSQMVIDNRGGAGGTVGATLAAKAAPDGYTFFMGAVHHAIAPCDLPQARLRHREGLRADHAVADVPQVIVVNPKRVPATDLKDFVADCCARTRASTTTARPATAPRTTSPASCSSCRPRPSSPTSPTAAPARRCRT